MTGKEAAPSLNSLIPPFACLEKRAGCSGPGRTQRGRKGRGCTGPRSPDSGQATWSMRGGVWHRLCPITQAPEAEGHRFKAVLSYTISLCLKRPDPLSQRPPQGSVYLDLTLKWLPECKHAPTTNGEHLTKEPSPCAGEQ